MSKLDEILENPPVGGYEWEVYPDDVVEQKKDVKNLFMEIIGEDELIPTIDEDSIFHQSDYRIVTENLLRAELRSRVKEL